MARSSSSSSQSRSRPAGSSKGRPTPKRPPTRKSRPKLYGSEVPRIFTPPLRPLTPETSLGFSVIKFADEVLRYPLLPWQRWLLIHALELLPDNSLRFRYVVVLVARQNGKSTLSQILGLWFMYVYGIALVLGTAQDLDTAEEVWQGAVDLVLATDDDDNLIRPELAALVDHVVQTNGKKALKLKTKKRWKVKAANRRAGRGLSGDVIFLDELREHQSWDAWGAITKTTTARAFALVLAMSNAGDSTSIVLRHLRMMAHRALGDPDGIVAAAEKITGDAAEAIAEAERLLEEVDLDDEYDDDLDDDEWDADDDFDEDELEDDSLGLFEWSARPDRAVNDRQGWVEANPSLGYTITEKTLASMCRTDPEWVFRTESLCQWPGFTLAGPFPPGAWDAGRWKGRKGEKPPKIVGKVKAGVAMSHDRKTTYIAFAGINEHGLPQVEIVAQRPGVDWATEWLSEEKRRSRISELGGRKGGHEAALLKKIAGKKWFTVVEGSEPDVAEWTGELYDLVKAGAVDEDDNPVGIRHLPQPSLDIAAGNAVVKPVGRRYVWDAAKSPVDIGALDAATAAVGLLVRTPSKKTPTARIRVIGGRS